MRKFLNIVKSKSASKPIFIALVLATYTFFTFVSMAPSIVNCSNTTAGIGDSTGGPVWRASLEPEQSLAGGPENMTNFPYGENLYSPVNYAAVIQTVMIKGADKVVGPVCAFNVMNILGFLTSSLVMFAFIYFLTKNKWISWLAGYAVAFTPYAQSKIGGHPSYGYVSFLILVLWALILVLTRRKYIYGFALSFALALCAYFDPYFILFAITILIPTVLFWGGYTYKTKRKEKEFKPEFIQTVKVLILSLIALLTLAAPLAYVRIAKSAEINSTTGAIRGDVMASAINCSNLPQDYLLPDPYNSYMTQIFGLGFTSFNINLRHWCGSGESRVAISLSMLITISAAGVILYRRKNEKSKYEVVVPGAGVSPKLLIGVLLSIIVAAGLLGLPPKLKGIYMPAALVIKATETWRIYAREYMVINMAVVILFALALKYLYLSSKGNAKKYAKFIFIGIALLIFMEYQYHDPFRPFTFSYKRDVPQIYRELKDDPSVKAIAEYPLDRLGIESDVIVYYTTMQTVHMKPILNSAIALNANEKLHNSIKDLSDPQTIPILRSMGITHVTIHGMTIDEVRAKTDQLEIIKSEIPPVFGLTLLRKAPTNEILLAKIKDGPKKPYALVINKGFVVNLGIMKDPLNMEYEALPDPELAFVRVGGNSETKQAVCLDIKMAAVGDRGTATILINDVPHSTIYLTGDYTRLNIEANENDIIVIDTEPGRNTRLNNLGC